MKNRVCTRCLADRTVKHISFDGEGICNFCRDYDKIKDKLHDYVNLNRLYNDRIKKADGYDYDAAVGFSGGKDSTYVLTKAVREDGLKVKAFTLDNGFLSDEAKSKIDAIVKLLKVEHEYVTFDRQLLSKVYNYTVKKFLSPCIACSFLGYAVMINYASKVNAKICLHGRSIPQMLRAFRFGSTDVVQNFMFEGLKEAGETDLNALYASAVTSVKKYVNKNIGNLLYSLTADARSIGYREFVPYFLYHPYDKKAVIEYITKEVNWGFDRDDEHFDCLIHNAAMYIKNIVARRPHVLPELCVSVREETLSRDEAYGILQGCNVAYPQEEMSILCDTAKVSEKALLFKARLYAKRWW